MLALCEQGEKAREIDFALGIFAEHFATDSDITDAAVLDRQAAAAGFDPARLARQLGSPSRCEQLEHNTMELIHRGGFGTPSMFIGDQLFFGNDRIPLVEWMLGPIGDDEFVMPGQHSKI